MLAKAPEKIGRASNGGSHSELKRMTMRHKMGALMKEEYGDGSSQVNMSEKKKGSKTDHHTHKPLERIHQILRG
jgi:anti-sigma factor ChrR (cupin superfamily)